MVNGLRYVQSTMAWPLQEQSVPSVALHLVVDETEHYFKMQGIGVPLITVSSNNSLPVFLLGV